jgi:integrase
MAPLRSRPFGRLKSIRASANSLLAQPVHSIWKAGSIMPRRAALRRAKGYWFTQAGDRHGTYFGRIDEVSYAEAKRRFGEFLAAQKYDRKQQELPTLSVVEICNAHLQFAKDNRSDALYKQRKSILTGFCNFRVGNHYGERLTGHGHLVGQLRAKIITRAHVEAYLQFKRNTPTAKTGRPLGEQALRHIVIAVKACWNWAADAVQDGGGGLLPADQRPLSKLPRGFVQPKDLTEADLPTDEEIEILFRWAAVEPSKLPAGTGRWRRRLPDEYVTAESRTFADLLRTYHATGARTSELCEARVRDFMPRTKQICLGKHKRTRTQHNPAVRNIQADDDLMEIIVRNAHDKQPDDPLFTHRDSRAWNQGEVNARLRALKLLAAECGQVVRDHVTPYSFRDLYISELLMLGVEPFKVSKMAGTSLREIERTYGHFYNHDLATAQERLARARKQRVGKEGRRKSASRKSRQAQ